MSPSQDITALLPSHFRLVSSTQITALWSNYGYIHRLHVTSANARSTLILKSIHPPLHLDPSESNTRKLLSYAVERWFYAHLAASLPPTVKVATSHPVRADSEHALLLEDLAVAYPFPAPGSLGPEAARCVLRWLGGFHGTFYRVHCRDGVAGKLPLVPPPLQWRETVPGSREGVWRRGTYWYLDTRREELAETDEKTHGWLLPWVEKVNDAVVRETQTCGTLLHGDVKGANIVFSCSPHYASPGGQDPLTCALYDLQYVGLGLATHDIVYFLGTSVRSSLLNTVEQEKELLRVWLEVFGTSGGHVLDDNASAKYDFDTLWKHWELSIVDWYRFMAGWGFWGNDQWVERRAREIVRDQERMELLVN